MAESYEITKHQLYILIISGVCLAVLFIVLGFVLGRNVQIPEPFPSVEEIAGSSDENMSQWTEVIQDVPKSTKDSSESPHIPNENLTFYDQFSKNTPPPPTPTEPPQTSTTVESYAAMNAAKPTVAATAVPEIPPTAAITDSAVGFSVQLSANKRKEFADELKDGLVKKGYPAYVSKQIFKNKNVSYRVRVGPYSTKAEAERIASQLEKNERIVPWIVQVSKTDE